MFYKFENEIKELEIVNIKDKEEILYIYVDFYKEFITSISFCHKLMIQGFEEFLTKMFISKAWLQTFNNTNYHDFFNMFLIEIKKKVDYFSATDRLDNNATISSLTVIERYLKQTRPLDNESAVKVDYVDKLEYLSELIMKLIINKLNETNMDFYTKAHIMLIIKEYLNDFSNAFNSIYNPYIQNNNTTYNMKLFITELINSIPEIVEKSKGFDTFEINLRTKTYELVKSKIDSNDEAFRNFDNARLNVYYNSLDDSQRETFMLLITEKLSGYQKIDDEENKFQKFRQSRTKRKIKKELSDMGYKITN